MKNYSDTNFRAWEYKLKNYYIMFTIDGYGDFTEYINSITERNQKRNEIIS